MNNWQHNTIKTISILMPLAFAFAVALDIYIPAVPQIVNLFHSSPAKVQLTLSLFMLSFGIGQLFIGPLSDQFGRRVTALVSALGYIVSSLLCAIAHSIDLLIIFRMLEAFFACGMMVSANAIIRDVYDEANSGRMYSYLNGSIAMSPLFAPLIGGYLDIYFGWRSTFVALAIFGVLAIFIILSQVQETHAKHKRLPIKIDVFKRYGFIIKNKKFQFFTFAGGSGVACLFTFFSVSPYLLINDLGIARQHFGFYFGVMGLLFFAGSIIAGKVVTKIGLRKNIIVGACLIFGGGLWMLLWNYHSGLSRASFIVPMVPISLGAAFLIGAGAAGAMEPFGEMAGTAAALFGSIEFLFAAMVGTIVMQFPTQSAAPLAVAVSLLGVLIMLWYVLWQSKKTFSTS